MYKRTLVEEFNKGLDMSLNSSRLGRIRLSSQQLASLEQLQAAQRAKAGGGGGAGAAAEEGGGGGSGGGAGAAPLADAPAAAAAAAANTASSTEVSIGSDVAFAMDEGTGSTRRIRCWIGRVVKLFKGKAAWRRPVAVDGDLPADIFAVCEWYSEVQQSSGLKFRFRQVTDRTKYCFVNFIGIVRIDFDSHASSSKEDRYTITQEQRSHLDDALKMTTPVRRGGKMTVAEQQQKKAQQEEEIANQARPRMSHIRPSQHRAASRGNSSAAASSSSSLSPLSSSSRPQAGSGDGDDGEMTN